MGVACEWVACEWVACEWVACECGWHVSGWHVSVWHVSGWVNNDAGMTNNHVPLKTLTSALQSSECAGFSVEMK